MKQIVETLLFIFSIATLVVARPDDLKGAGGEIGKVGGAEGSKKEPIPIIRDDRENGEDGSYSVNFETGNGIVVSRSGSPTGPNGSVVQEGSVKFTFPSGEPYELTYVANEKGFQPESPLLPVAPEFPHPIPDFVQQQIEKARQEDQGEDGAEQGADDAEYYVEDSAEPVVVEYVVEYEQGNVE